MGRFASFSLDPMLVRAGGRLALRASSSRALTPLVAFQHFPLDGLPSRRNYWWSKQTTPSSPAQVNTVLPEEVVPSDQIAQHVSPADVPATGISEAVTNVIPPLQYGDFAALGLSGWSPSGIMSWSFELLQVTTGIPWFYTIVAGTLFWRVALIPTTLTSMRNAARLRPHSEQIKALDDQAQTVKDRAAQMEIMLKKQKLIEQAGVSLQSMFLPPIIQMVGNFGLFFAVKSMVQLPVAQLAQSGVWFLPDLTLTGDYVMPTLLLLATNVQFSLMKKELDPSKPVMAHAMNVMRVASFATLPIMSGLPTGLWLSMLTGLLLSITQSSLLRVPRIRQALAIPPTTPTPPVTMRDTGRAILEWYHRKKVEAGANQVVNERKPNWTSLPKASRRAR